MVILLRITSDMILCDGILLMCHVRKKLVVFYLFCFFKDISHFKFTLFINMNFGRKCINKKWSI